MMALSIQPMPNNVRKAPGRDILTEDIASAISEATDDGWAPGNIGAIAGNLADRIRGEYVHADAMEERAKKLKGELDNLQLKFNEVVAGRMDGQLAEEYGRALKDIGAREEAVKAREAAANETARRLLNEEARCHKIKGESEERVESLTEEALQLRIRADELRALIEKEKAGHAGMVKGLKDSIAELNRLIGEYGRLEAGAEVVAEGIIEYFEGGGT